MKLTVIWLMTSDAGAGAGLLNAMLIFKECRQEAAGMGFGPSLVEGGVCWKGLAA